MFHTKWFEQFHCNSNVKLNEQMKKKDASSRKKETYFIIQHFTNCLVIDRLKEKYVMKFTFFEELLIT